MQGVCVAVRVLELHPAREAQVVFAEAQLLHGLLRGHQPQALQGEGRRGRLWVVDQHLVHIVNIIRMKAA